MKKHFPKILLILHNIRSIYNVGSIFRTADAAGVSKIFLTGITPSPRDRFGRMRKDFGKVSLGAEKNVLWEHSSDIFSVLETLKKDNIQCIAIEQAPSAVDYKKVVPKKSYVLVFGNEVEGLPTEVLQKCDIIAEIPMNGIKESLNVSVSLGIALFRISENTS
ncbi:MAG: TrmH family RNA methyltransferase [Patescibacteria group bacterium]